MPKSKKPRAFDPKHKELLDELAKWLGHEMKANPAEEPRALATRHLMEHGWNKEICKLCGAAKAIIDCVVSIDEQPASEVLQAIRKYPGHAPDHLGTPPLERQSCPRTSNFCDPLTDILLCGGSGIRTTGAGGSGLFAPGAGEDCAFPSAAATPGLWSITFCPTLPSVTGF